MELTDLFARWHTPEGRPAKGRLISKSHRNAADPLSCMCAQGQVLFEIGGWTIKQLATAKQIEADKATAELLRISRAHAVLLRHVNDGTTIPPDVSLTDPAQVLGAQWSRLLDFWHYLDGMNEGDRRKVVVARNAAWAAASAAAWAAASAAARAAARAAAEASNEIQGREVLEREGKPFFFLPMFGFASPDQIPARPADYGGAS